MIGYLPFVIWSGRLPIDGRGESCNFRLSHFQKVVSMTGDKTSNRKFVAIILLIGVIACILIQGIASFKMAEALSSSGLLLEDLISLTNFYGNVNSILSILSSIFSISLLGILVNDME